MANNSPLLSFYGDDFTGASAVMEVLTFAGVPTIMFLEPPQEKDLAKYSGIRAFGIAGVARSRDPKWMEENLPAAFKSLAQFGAPVSHYKTCSTFDSSPNYGSIGKAIEIGIPIFGSDWVPLVVGAPAIKRYQAFGHLFAGIDDEVYRLDRHPIMSKHPATPMDESDLSAHLAKQIDVPIGLVDYVSIKTGQGKSRLKRVVNEGAKIVSIDVMDEDMLAEIGRLIWENDGKSVFAIGSQGVEYALVAYWRAIGILPKTNVVRNFAPVDQIFCVSGSCSSITAAQIDYAEANGFEILVLDASLSVSVELWADALEKITNEVFEKIAAGKDVLVTTTRGPDDAATSLTDEVLKSAGVSAEIVHNRIGEGLGNLLGRVRRETQLSRFVVSGGDTSGHAMTALNVKAITAIAPLAPGAPLCEVHSDDVFIDGLQVTLKGGQMGELDFFCKAKIGAQIPEKLSAIDKGFDAQQKAKM